MKFQIKNRLNDSVIFEIDCDSMKTCVEAAHKSGADLSGAYLRDSDLSGSYLRGADLRDSDLSGADLRGAYLRGAYLSGADLRGACLSGACLSGSYLRDSDLSGADLSGADLRGAYPSGACLSGADLSGADLRGAYPSGSIDVAQLGQPNEWEAFAWHKNKTIMVEVGCRSFSLAESRKYWHGKDDRLEVLAALDYAEKIAAIRGWK